MDGSALGWLSYGLAELNRVIGKRLLDIIVQHRMVWDDKLWYDVDFFFFDARVGIMFDSRVSSRVG